MSFDKAQMSVDGDRLNWSMSFAKGDINEEKREVSGFATLDNHDTQGDVVLAEASRDAFERCRGNIREMHQPSAVGKLKNFVEKTTFDEEGNMYSGIYVTVHVSKGAQDAWEKVLDGTYSGFSIGGNITDSESQWVKDQGATIRFIKSYDLVELSLVDNPANQMANIFSITKAADGSTLVKGMIAEVLKENAFWCPTHSISDVSGETAMYCSVCKNEMELMGQISSDASRQELGEVVKKFLGNKGGVTVMSDELKKSEEVVETPGTEEEVVNTPEEVVPAVEPEAEVVTPEVAETVVVVDETEDNDLNKVINDLKNVVEKSVSDSREIAEEATRKLEESFTKANESYKSEMADMNAKYDELSNKLDAVKADNETTRKSLEALSGSTAFRKSGEVESPEAKPKKGGTFGGVFLSSTDDLD